MLGVHSINCAISARVQCILFCFSDSLENEGAVTWKEDLEWQELYPVPFLKAFVLMESQFMLTFVCFVSKDTVKHFSLFKRS